MRRNTCRSCGPIRSETRRQSNYSPTYRHSHDHDTECVNDIDEARASAVPGCGPPDVSQMVCPTNGVRYTPADRCEQTELEARGWTDAENTGDVPEEFPGDVPKDLDIPGLGKVNSKSAAAGAGVSAAVGLFLLG